MLATGRGVRMAVPCFSGVHRQLPDVALTETDKLMGEIDGEA